MKVFRIGWYFLRRGWHLAASSRRDVVLGILAIAMALLLWGVVLLLEENLDRAINSFGGDLKTRAYFDPQTSDSEQQRVVDMVTASSAAEEVRLVAAREAMDELAAAFPDLGSVAGPGGGVASGYLEWSWRQTVGGDSRQALVDDVTGDTAVAWLDDDQLWRGRMRTAVSKLKLIGVVLAALSILAAGFIAAAVVRLSAYRHRTELEVERLSGATELYVRSPFLVAALLQGVVAAGVALALLYGFWRGSTGLVADTIITDLVIQQFLSPLRIVLVLVVGAAASMIGAILALSESVRS